MSTVLSRVLSPLGLLALVAAPVALLSGCPGEDAAETTVEADPAAAALANVRGTLQSVAETGEGGSSLQGLDYSLEQLTVEPATKEKLMKLYGKLANSGQPEKVKAIAGDMLKLLPAAPAEPAPAT